MIGLKSERILLKDRIFSGYVYIEDGKISAISKDRRPCKEIYDFGEKYLSAGFIDLHTHGAGGCSFSVSSAEDVITACHYHMAHGTTALLPTVSTAPIKVMRGALADITAASEDPRLKNRIIGAHMEGPYLSAAQCGAQNTDYITAPIPEDYRALVEEYKGKISRWTYAPERDPDGEFCDFLVANGILPSVGHSDARYQELAPAIDKGCRLVTHLYSATSTVTRDQGFRSLGVIESAFLRDDMDVEIIADGRHLPAELIQMIVKIKGFERVAAITDSLFPAGTDIKEGLSDNVPFIVEDGVCKLPDRSAFAGSIATADRLLRVLTQDCGFAILDAVKMMTQVPARILGLNSGEIAPQKDADLIVFDEDICISDVFIGGSRRDL